MKSFTLFCSLLFTLGTTSSFAQTGAQDGSRFGKGEDSIRCIKNTSLYEPYAKSKNYKDALPFWELAFEECPSSSKNLYINGVKIVEWEISQEKDPAKKKALVDKLMKVYDQRMKYFGDDRSYPTSRLMGMKADDYVKYMGKDADWNLAYGWLKESIAARGAASGPNILKVYVTVANRIFRGDKENPAVREMYLNTYTQGEALLNEYQKGADPKMAEYTAKVKEYLGSDLAASGAADCDALNEMFGPQVEAKKTDLDFLKSTIALLRKSRCQESEVYFAASGYAHQIEPTMESAMGVAKQSIKKDDINQAIVYFKEAAELATEAADKAEIDLSIASLYYKQNSFSNARSYALKSLQSDPNQATPYILIANMYASSAKSIYPSDPVMAQAVYYAAVDKLEKARSAEPAKASEVNSIIASYRSRFPSVQDVFMHADLEKGKAVKIGGWIGESTIVR